MLVATLSLFAALLRLLLALGHILLFFLELLGTFRTLGGTNYVLLLCGLQLGVVIYLLLDCDLRVGHTLWRLRLVPRLIQTLLLLFTLRLRAVLLFGDPALWTLDIVLGFTNGVLLIAMGSAIGTFGLIQHRLTLVDGVQLCAAHILGLVDAARNKELAVASAFYLGVPILDPGFGVVNTIVFSAEVGGRGERCSGGRRGQLRLTPCGRAKQRDAKYGHRQNRAGSDARGGAVMDRRRRRKYSAHFITAPMRRAPRNHGFMLRDRVRVAAKCAAFRRILWKR